MLKPNRLFFFYFCSIFITILVTIPLFTIFLSFLGSTSEYFIILVNSFLSEYIFNTVFILLGVLILSFCFGFFSAYLVSFFSFPGVEFFKWALILSFAIPAYVYAYSLTAFFENYGTAYSILTNIFGNQEFNKLIPKFDGLFGSIISLSFSLFGYVFILTKASFIYQSQNFFEVGKNLGFSGRKTFLKIIIPSARPAIFIGLSLVAMETLSDFGAVSFFSINTLTTAIYNSWVSFDDLSTSYRLSIVLLFFVSIAFLVENIFRKNAKYHNSLKIVTNNDAPIKLRGIRSVLAFLFCSLLFILSFIFPTFQMVHWVIKFPKYIYNINFLDLHLNMFYLVIISCSVLIFFSIISNYSNRITKSKLLDIFSGLSIYGYAIPGIILALSFMSFFSWISNLLGINIKTIFIGSSLGLIFAYFVRFYSLSYNSIKTNYIKINQSVDESAYLLGYSKNKTFFKIHFPILKKSSILILILLSLEIIKELPMTLILKPFNFETFATIAYSYAEQDLLEAVAFPSLCLIFWSSLFIYLSSSHFFKKN